MPQSWKRSSTYTPTDRANIRTALMDGMDTTRTASATNADGPKTTGSDGLSATQRQALSAFVKVADGISRSLAADDLKAFNQQAVQLASVLPALKKELTTPHPLGALIDRLTAATDGNPAPNLGEARTRFLTFSTATAELAKVLRKTDPKFSGLKIYHCPMAPKPGLWMQANSPLANPFYGAKMLTCGDEVIE